MELITAVSRYILPVVTVILLTKCIMTLLLGHPKEKIYGYIIDMRTGEKYALNMWETSIGRSNTCDIVITYNTVSRSHAVISRRIDGWYVYDLNSKSGIKVNGIACEKKTTINNGDIISLSNVPFRFEIIDDPVQRVGKKKKQGKKAAQTPPPSRADAPAQGAAPISKVNVQNVIHDTDFISEQDFYDDYNKPHINIKKQQGESAPITSDIYSEKGSFTIETPKSTAKQRTAFQPRLINKDSGEVFILCGNEVSIGSGMKNDIRLRSREVSRVHALLVLYEDGWAIENASQSGTFLNTHKVTSPQLLFDGDVIALGDERLYYKTNR